METRYLRVFYSFSNKCACFVICKNYFCFLSGLFSFTKTHFLESKSAHLDFCATNLSITCFAVINSLSVFVLHPKQCVSCFF